METLIDLLCQHFHCAPLRLREILNHPVQREQAAQVLKGKNFKTTYLRGKEQLIHFGGLSLEGADHLLAYNGYCNRMTVMQHFFGRHRIRLIHASMPCVIHYSRAGNASYFPMELLTLSS